MDTSLSSFATPLSSRQTLVILPEVHGGGTTLNCPFATSLNPCVAFAEQRGLAWAQRFGLLISRKALVAGRLEYIQFSAFVHPQVPLERLQIVSDFFTWLFLFDDKLDESPQGKDLGHLTLLHDRFREVLRGAGPNRHDDRFTHALYDLRTRIATLGNEAILARFVSSMNGYFQAGQWEATNRCQGTIPEVSTYLAMRAETGAVYPCFDLIGITDRLDLPDSVFYHDSVKRLALLANRVICWCNDIYSLTKERQQEDVHNLVLVFQHAGQLSLPAALNHAVRVHNQDVAEFVALSARLPRFSPAIDFELERYVSSLRTWMRANYEFSRTAARYRSA